MSNCSNCGTTIIFGGLREGRLHYCGKTCRQKHDWFIDKLRQMSDNVVVDQAQTIHRGACPKCGGPGPVDLFTSYRIWSVIVLTSWVTTPELCCRRCATTSKVSTILFSAALGWWGVPWGVIGTPIQVCRNFAEWLSPPDSARPSEELLAHVRIRLVTQTLESEQVYAAQVLD